MINTFLADDHAVIRKGLQLFISNDQELSLVGEAVDGEDLFNKLPSSDVDVLLLDIDMPKTNGITALRTLAEDYPHVKVLILSMHPEEIYGLTARKLGAKGYLSKDSNPAEIIAAIKEVYAGQEKFNEEIYKKNKKGAISTVKLSKRESEVLKLISSGKSNKEISQDLEISDKTVSTYKLRLLKKLGAKNVVDLINFGQKHQF